MILKQCLLKFIPKSKLLGNLSSIKGHSFLKHSLSLFDHFCFSYIHEHTAGFNKWRSEATCRSSWKCDQNVVRANYSEFYLNNECVPCSCNHLQAFICKTSNILNPFSVSFKMSYHRMNTAENYCRNQTNVSTMDAINYQIGYLNLSRRFV